MRMPRTNEVRLIMLCIINSGIVKADCQAQRIALYGCVLYACPWNKRGIRLELASDDFDFLLNTLKMETPSRCYCYMHISTETYSSDSPHSISLDSLSSDVRGLIAHQEVHDISHFLDGTVATSVALTEQVLLAHFHLSTLVELLHHVTPDQTWTQAVDADIVGCILLGGYASEAEYTVLAL